jgi:serine/threonine protein kinase
MELMSTDLLNLLNANAKVGIVPDVREALIYTIGIARGMRHLHMLGLVHRDLKSSNVLIGKDSRAKVTGTPLHIEIIRFILKIKVFLEPQLTSRYYYNESLSC